MKRLIWDLSVMALVAALTLGAIMPTQAYAGRGSEAKEKAKMLALVKLTVITTVVTQMTVEATNELIIRPVKKAIDNYVVKPIQRWLAKPDPQPDPKFQVCPACHGSGL